MKIFTIILFSILTNIVYSQDFCGTKISEEDMQDFYQRDHSHINNNLKAGTILEIPVVYHLTRENNGTGGFSLAETFRLHCELNNNFTSAEIHFYIKDIVYHNNSGYHHMSPNGIGGTMMQNENNLDVCNIYIVDEAKSFSTPVCGYSFRPQSYPGPNRGGIVLDIGCSGPESTTLTHEMGHYLNLPHTFSGWEGSDYSVNPIPTNQWENANGNNCLSRGDGFCDTPPDYISDRWPCLVPKIFSDANNQTFTVDEKNYMSYSSDVCQAYFKPDQKAEMKNAPAIYRSYLLNLNVPTFHALDIPNVIFPQNGLQNIAFDTVDFVWAPVSDADYYLIEVTYNNFNNVILREVVTTNSFQMTNLNTNQDYNWRVKAINYTNVCNNYYTGSFKTAIFLSNVEIHNVSCKGDDNAYVKAFSNSTVHTYKLYAYNNMTMTYDLIKTSTSNAMYSLAPNSYYIESIRNGGDKTVKYFTITEPTELELELMLENSSIKSVVTGGVAPFTYIWSNEGGNEAINTKPITGENKLFLIDNNGCSISKILVIEEPIVEEPEDTSKVNPLYYQFTYYPNPYNGEKFAIEFYSKYETNIDFKILSLDGKVVQTINKDIVEEKNHLEMNINQLSKGIYYINFEINNKVYYKKVIL